MDFSKFFEVVSSIDPSVCFTFRRLTTQQAAVLRLEVIAAVDPHIRSLEKLQKDGASDLVQANFSAVATNATVIPITVRHCLKHVVIGEKKIKGEDWISDPETSEDLMDEAYRNASRGARMTAAELGEWLSPGTSSQAAQASATNTGASTASASASTSSGTVADTSPTA